MNFLRRISRSSKRNSKSGNKSDKSNKNRKKSISPRQKPINEEKKDIIEEKNPPQQNVIKEKKEEPKIEDKEAEMKVIGNKIESESWKLNDAISIYSKSIDEYLPGVIVDLDNETKEATVRFWDIQSLELKHKKQPFDSENIKTREYETKYDPWDMPIDKGLEKHHFVQIKELLDNKFGNSIKHQTLQDAEIEKWFGKFQKFLKQKKELRRKNPFIRLISSYLCESAVEWMEIFVNYIFILTVFNEESHNNDHYELKLNILFDTMNIGSDNIDQESLQIICMMYAKCWIIESQGKLDEQDNKQRKKEIAKLAKKMLKKIVAYDASIDKDEFKGFIQESQEMTKMITHSVKNMILTEKHNETLK